MGSLLLAMKVPMRIAYVYCRFLFVKRDTGHCELMLVWPAFFFFGGGGGAVGNFYENEK